MAWGVTWMLATARYVAGLDGAVLRVDAFPFWMFAGITLGFLWFMLWQGRMRFVGATVMILFLCCIPFVRSPDVLVSSDAGLFAIKNEEGGLLFSTGRGDSYAVETWLRRNAQDAGLKRSVWPKEGAADALRCDAFACRMEKNGQTISFIRSLRAVPEECAWARVIISGLPVEKESCNAYVIDRFSVWRNGAHSLYLDKGGITVQTVEEKRGLRPWTQTAANRKKE
jgi:competence protein ComEC